MSDLSDRMYAQARIVPLQPQNKVREVTKKPNGNLIVTLYSGDTFELDKDDTWFQAWVIYTVVADL